MRLEDLVLRQDGVVALPQAVGCGISARTVHRWARERRWRRLHPAVYLVGGHRLTAWAQIRAAVLWAGEHAVVTGQAAAFWNGLIERAPAVVEVTVPAAAKPRARAGVRVRRRDLDPADVALVNGIRVAAPPLAALETACVLRNGSTILDRALQTRVRFPALYRCYTRMIGRTGARAALELLVAAADRADSAAERLLVGLLRDAGTEGWVLGHAFAQYRIDIAFPDLKIAVEVDGWAWHVDAERFRADRRKGNALTAAGWILLRYTWHDLKERPREVVAEILAAVIAVSGT